MRIGLVCPYSFDEPGGVQAHILDLAAELLSRGHHVEVIGPASEDAEVPDFVHRGGSSVAIPYNGSVARLSVGPRVRRQVKSFINDGRFDVLHIHEPNSPSFSLYALLVAEGAIVATYHAHSEGSLLLNAAKGVLSPQLEKIRGGIAVSEMARRWQVSNLGGDPVLIPNGVEVKKYADAAQERTSEIVEIAFLGRLDEPRKGLAVLLSALELVDRPVRVTVMGGGNPRDVPGIDFVGRVSDEEKREILGRADIYVAPNTGGESFGIVLVEAMAAGAAVVASDLEAFSLVTGDAGMLFPNGDAEALAEMLTRLIDDPTHRRTIAAAGARRAWDYDWSVVADQVLAVYETVADGKPVTAG